MPTTASPMLYKSRIELPLDTRAEAAQLLNQRLADCIDLQTQCKQAHWNVKGPQFIGLHELFDQVNAAVREYIDLIAERVVQLGGIAEGTARIVAQHSTLAEYPTDISSGEEHVVALSDALAHFGGEVRKGIDEMERLEDTASADLLTEVTRGIDKWLWFVEAHVQGALEGSNGGDGRSRRRSR